MPTLLAETIRLLKQCPQREEVAAAIGVSPAWLKHLVAGRYKDPGVNKVQRLYEHLTGRALL